MRSERARLRHVTVVALRARGLDVTVSVGRAPQLEGLAEAAKCDGAGLEDDDA